MSDSISFTVTDEHLKLLQNMWVEWDDCEFGAPEIDPKRPYGNSDVYGDIAEILGEELGKDEWGDPEATHDQMQRYGALHRSMQTVLQILVANRGIVAGEYRGEKYSTNWERI